VGSAKNLGGAWERACLTRTAIVLSLST
jgi:hypothetical protein